jgi:predicted TPR repeat methyltransferase
MRTARAGRARIDRKARDFFEDLWKQGDPWELDTSEFEQQRLARLLATLDGRRYQHMLEIGCGTGSFTRHLARIADHIVALDIAPAAIARTQTTAVGPGIVDFRLANIMEYDVRAEGPWDLVVMSETIYYLGWLYPFFDVGWLASELFASTRVGGRLLLANTEGGCDDALLLPWLIRTYRDLFLNVGYDVEAEDLFCGAKHGIDLKVLISLFTKPSSSL